MKESHELVKRTRDIRELSRSQNSVSSAQIPLSYGVENETENEVNLRDYWLAVRKRLWLVIGIAAIVTMLATIYMSRKPDIYQAQTRVQVDLEHNNPAVGASKTSSIIYNNPVNDPAYFNTQLQILTGPGLLRRVVKTLDLEHSQAFLRPQDPHTRTTWQALRYMVGQESAGDKTGAVSTADDVLLTNSVAAATSREDLVEAKRLAPYVGALQGGLKVEPVKETRTGYSRDTRLIDIRFEHQDPQVAAKVVNAVADTFVLSNLEKKTETNITAGKFLVMRIAELQRDIRAREEELVNYAKNHQILTLDPSQNTVVDRLSGLNKQLLEAENERKTTEAAFQAARAPAAVEAMVEADSKFGKENAVKLAELRQKRAQLLVENTEEWPEVKEIDQQIAVLQSHEQETHKRATSAILTNLETRYKQAASREQALRTAFNQQRAEVVTQNESAINYRIIQQEIDTNKDLLNGLLQRSKENEAMQADTPNNLSVVDYAIAPEGPIGPNRMRTVFLSLLVSLALGVGLALFLEYLDDTVHSTEEVERTLHLPALAVIPATGSASRHKLLPSSRVLQTRNGGGSGTPELLINADARSPLAEAYRQLRTSVLLSTAGRPPKSLLVTSSLPGEGKTTTAVNTAFSLAQTGSNVVIVDADMRRPRLHSIFDLKNRRGLSTILSSEMSEAEILSMIVQQESTGLHVLTSGPVPPNPAELIGSEQMRKLLACLEASFSHIVIDSPPITSFTDGVLISSMADGVLLVVHGGKSSRHVVRRSKQLLQDIGAKIFGVVLNNVNITSHNYYYYQTYYQQAYYSDVEASAADVGRGAGD